MKTKVDTQTKKHAILKAQHMYGGLTEPPKVVRIECKPAVINEPTPLRTREKNIRIGVPAINEDGCYTFAMEGMYVQLVDVERFAWEDAQWVVLDWQYVKQNNTLYQYGYYNVTRFYVWRTEPPPGWEDLAEQHAKEQGA